MARARPQRGFTLIELLVVVGIIAVLAAVLLPSLAVAREAARISACQANLRQAAMACRMYADANRGYGPAIGEPYNALPNWALVVLRFGRSAGPGDGRLYGGGSVLVCPTIQATYGMSMLRTCAMNATGHAGAQGDAALGIPPDPDTYDDPTKPAHIRFDRVPQPSTTPLLMDSARSVPATGGAPPSSRTASMLDFREPSHIQPDSPTRRLGLFHRRGKSFNVVAFDGSANAHTSVRAAWREPLP